MNRRRRRVALGALCVSVALGAAWLASRHHADIARCFEGTNALGPRCCFAGQQLDASGRCVGSPVECPPAYVRSPTSCVPHEHRVLVPAGNLDGMTPDWEAAGRTDLPRGKVDAFLIDSHEVTHARWSSCVRAGSCRAFGEEEEDPTPVRGVALAEAITFCRFVHGAVPTPEQFALAAAGSEGRRYPWGGTGAVCRRAAFGLVEGPCADGGIGPDLVGARPAGVTPTGVHDLAGNVAEWAYDGKTASIRGGSFRSTSASALRSWAGSVVPSDAPPPDDVGFRCVYPVEREGG